MRMTAIAKSLVSPRLATWLCELRMRSTSVVPLRGRPRIKIGRGLAWPAGAPQNSRREDTRDFCHRGDIVFDPVGQHLAAGIGAALQRLEGRRVFAEVLEFLGQCIVQLTTPIGLRSGTGKHALEFRDVIVCFVWGRSVERL